MSNQTPSPETVIKRAIESAMRRVSTAEPGVIEAYDPVTCTADVQPLVLRVVVDENGDRVTRRAPVLSNVPVLHPGGGGGRLTFPVKRGDNCLIIAASVPIDRWNALGGEVDPQTTRHHHVSDAIALVGLTPSTKASLASATAVVLEGTSVCIGAEAGAEPTYKGTSFQTALSTYVAAINTFAGTCTTTPAGTPATALATAATAFLAAASAALTAKAKVF